MNSKEEQRKNIKNLRLGMDKETYQAYSDNICKNLMKTEKYKNAEYVMAYCPINNEVDTSLILNDCIRNKKLVLPKTNVAKNEISAHIIKNAAELMCGAYGILEPTDGCEIIASDRIDIVIVPIVAFDKNGGRLGYGGGYYDRFLLKNNELIKIGIAFSFQQVDEIDIESHDAILDMVITESNILRFKKY